MATWTSFKRKKGRDKLFVISSILNIARDEAMKTQIMYQANLSFTQLNDYLRFMLRIDLLQKISIDRKEMYKITGKGLDFLQRYNEMQEVVKTEGLYQYERQNRLPKIKHELGELRKAIDNLETDLSNTINCPKCQASVFSDYQYCPYCGTCLYIETVKKAAE